MKCNEVTVTENQVKFYNDYGYLVIEGVMSSADCDEVQKIAETLADEQHSVVLNAHRKSEELFAIMENPVIVKCVKSVQRSPIVGLNSQYLFKKCGTPYARQSWTPHQDNSYPKAPPEAYIIAHLSLEDSDNENGGLIFWPKSHVEPLLEFKKNKSWKEDFDDNSVSHPGQTVEIPEKYQPMDMKLKKGSLCLMHGHLIHGSYPNLSNSRSRPQYSMAYLNKGSPFETGSTSIKEPMEVE